MNILISSSFSRCLFLFLHIIFFSRITESYIMPVCSENGGVCTVGMCDFNDISYKTSSLFGFVTDLMEMLRGWLYVIGIESGEEEPKTVLESMISFFGFKVSKEPEVVESSNTARDYSVFGLIFALYFGYLFMATKCFSQRKPADDPFSMKKFVDYLAPENASSFETDDELIDEEIHEANRSTCWICEQHKLSMETENEENVESFEIASFPPCEISKH